MKKMIKVQINKIEMYLDIHTLIEFISASSNPALWNFGGSWKLSRTYDTPVGAVGVVDSGFSKQ